MSRVPMFTVIVPTRRIESNLDKSIKSIWAQTCVDFELVVVVDDASAEVRLPLDPHPDRRQVHVVYAPGLEPLGAVNSCATVGTGKFLAFLMPSDAFHPDRLEAFARAFAKMSSVEWGFSGVQAIDAFGQPIEATGIRDASLRQRIWRSVRPLEVTRALEREDGLVSPGNLVVARDLFERIGGFRNLYMSSTWDLALRLLETHRPYAAERALYQLRLPAASWNAGRWNDLRHRSSRDGLTLQILAEHRARLLSRDTFNPAPDPFETLLPDEEVAVQSALWALRSVRRISPAYSALRAGVRLVQKLRTR